ncbi:MAG: amino acid permease [Pseudomonadota bacterium]
MFVYSAAGGTALAATLSTLLRKKRIRDIIAQSEEPGQHLKRTLGALDLVALGIGCIVGAGIFVLTGVAAAQYAGPGIVLSFVISGLACAFSAFAYAEFASMMPAAGSAYSYAYATLGEIFAWIIGWDLVLEYSVGASAVAVGWSGYFNSIVQAVGIHLPEALINAPGAVPGALVNLPAMLVVAATTLVLVIGIQESSSLNKIVVGVKIAVILFFIGVGAFAVQPANWRPFAPFGWKGIMTGAAIVFFAYIGFDAVSTTAEEARNPKRDLPIGIIASLAICTLLYIAVALVLTGIVPYYRLDSPAPMAVALEAIGHGRAALLVAVGAVSGLTSVLLVMLLGQSRVFFAMARDNLLPPRAAAVHPRFHTPYRTTIFAGTAVALASGLLPIGTLAELCNIGTLFAFVLVSAGVLALRRTHPDRPRPFRCPGVPFVPLAGIGFCLYLMASLPWETWMRFVVWLAVGLVIYFNYGIKHSRLAEGQATTERTRPLPKT